MDQFNKGEIYDKKGIIESEYNPVAYCTDIICSREATVFPYNAKASQWFCIKCKRFFDRITECMRCGDLLAGDNENYLVCSHCSSSFSND